METEIEKERNELRIALKEAEKRRSSLSFFEEVKAAIAHAEHTERELDSYKFRKKQLETVLKIMARRNESQLAWTSEEVIDAFEDPRCIMLGALDMELYGEEAPESFEIGNL